MKFRKSTLVNAALAAVIGAGLFAAAGTAMADNHGHARAGYGENKNQKTIVAVAKEAGQFNTLVAAVQAAGLAETLMGEGPFTVFAPNDEAFAKLPSGTVENLLQAENREQLRGILLYHVASGSVKAEQVTGLNEVPTVQGEAVRIETRDNAVILNGNARVIQTDIEASNGVIHVIDTVLMPGQNN